MRNFIFLILLFFVAGCEKISSYSASTYDPEVEIDTGSIPSVSESDINVYEESRQAGIDAYKEQRYEYALQCFMSVEKVAPTNNDLQSWIQRCLQKLIPKDFVLVPGGHLSYKGNYYEDYKKHSVDIDSFYVCRFELTQGEYQRVRGSLNKKNYSWLLYDSWTLNEGPRYMEVRGDSIPVQGCFRDFAEYCNIRSKQEGYDGFYEIKKHSITINPSGNGYRLLTPYEWIFAAYGGNLNKIEKYLGGKNLSEVAWHYGNSKKKPNPVGKKNPNIIGLYDIQGNAPELLQGDGNHRCYCSMMGGYNVSNWNYEQTYDPTYIWYPDDDSEWTYGTRIVFIPKTLENRNIDIRYKI